MYRNSSAVENANNSFLFSPFEIKHESMSQWQ
jgi:hypothetical protein